MSNDLDRLMAERVMGWKLGDTYWHGESVGGISAKYSINDWHPTSDIAQAMMCAKKIGGLVLTEEYPEKHGGERWCAEIGWQAPAIGNANADTPALAICKAIAAALKEQPSQPSHS